MGARGDAFGAVRSPSAADLIAASNRATRSATPIDGSQPSKDNGGEASVHGRGGAAAIVVASLAILLGAPIALRRVGRVPPRYKITFRSEVPFVAVTDQFREPQYVNQFFEAPICPASAASGGDPVMLGAKIGVARRTADGSAIPSAPFSSDCPGE